MKSVRRLFDATDGNVAVETALVLSLLLVPMLLCLWDFATVYQARADAEEALQDAITYVMNAGATATNAGITSAAQAANGSTVSVSTSTVCYCVSNSTTVPTMPTSVSCTGSCTGSTVLQQFMKVVTTNNVTVPFPVSWLNLPSPYAATATGYGRIG
jgi:Flp pilus assembly protein TadG